MNYYLKKEINQTLRANFKKIAKRKKVKEKRYVKICIPL